MGGFLPPVVLLIQANAKQAIAEMGKVNTQLTAMEAKALKAGKSISLFNKTAVVGTTVLKGFALAFTALSALGVKALMDIEKSYNRLGQAMSNQGLATKENLQSTSELVSSYESLGFGSEKAADAMTVLVTATGDLAKSQNLLAISSNLARAQSISLEDASRALVRAQAGNIKLFTQFGIKLDDTKPKAEAVAEAMGKLEARLKGQADAYAKTTAGQLAILKEGFGDLAEAVGGPVLVALNKFLAGINRTGKFLADHQEILFGVATVIVGVMIPAIVTMTKKLYANAVAWAVANAPILAVVAAVAALGAAFVWAWNKFDWFRKGIVEGLKLMLKWWGFLLRAIGVVAEGFTKIITGPLKLLLKGLGFFNDDAKKMAESLEKLPASVGDFFDKAASKVEGFSKTVDTWKDKKIDINFSLPKIKDFGNGVPDLTKDVKEVSEALVQARQDAQDFQNKMVETATNISNKWKALIGRDVNDAIRFALLDPVDQLVEKSSKLITGYNEASSKFVSANSQLTSAQRAYENAVKGTDKALIASADSALKRARANVEAVMGNIESALEDIQALQDELISSIANAYKEIDSLQKERAKVLADANKEEAKLTKDHLANLAEIRKDYDVKVAQAQKDAAKRTADIVRQSVDQLRGIYRSATQKSVGDIFSGLTFEGKYLKGGTTTALINALGLQLNKANTLADDAAKLSGLGFTQTFIEQVVAQGPDVGHKLAQTIINSTPESVKQLQEYWLALEKQSQHGVDSVAEKLNSGMTLATEELTAQLAQVSKDLNDQLAVYASELTEATAKAVATYNEQLKQIRDETAATIAQIDGQISALYSKIGAMRGALDSLAGISAPSTSTYVGGNTGTSEPEKIAEDVKEQTKAVLTSTTSKYTVKPGDTLSAIAKAQGTTLAKLLKDNPKFTEVDKYKGGNMIWAGTTVNITANTNASSQSIANDVGWAVRTSSDVQYSKSSTDIIAERRMRDGYL
jgi:LysM repeat protein